MRNVRSVFVVGVDASVRAMFSANAHRVVDDPQLADIICFTGGADVSPALYGQENTASYCEPARDRREKALWERFRDTHAFVGICRGGQFLNVMNGGSMVQDLPVKHTGLRVIRSLGHEFITNEDHHQGMVPGRWGFVLAKDAKDNNPEVIGYGEHTLCFQAHPEWGHKPTEKFFFNLMEGLSIPNKEHA